MLSPLDDYPVHQIAAPIRQVGTSDRNFYDRYYFNMHPSSDELFLVAGMGQYPNLGVADAFVVVLHEGKHRVVRASRELGLDRMDTTVGPFRIEVLEGLQRLRVVCEPNEWGVELDVTWEGAVPAHEEERHFIRAPHGRVTFDTSRLAQTGSWSGRLVIDGKQIEVTPDRWRGARDRSWGVRPVGEPEAPGINAASEPQFFWIYAPMQFDDFSIFTIIQERTDGSRVLEEAVQVFPASSGKEEVQLGRPDHELRFVPGTRQVKSATITFRDSPLVVDVEPLLQMHVGVGTGYGYDPDWRHGMYQGPLKVEGLTLDLANPDDQARMFGLVDSVARFEVDGHVGHSLFEYTMIGAHEGYGFTGLMDGFGT